MVTIHKERSVVIYKLIVTVLLLVILKKKTCIVFFSQIARASPVRCASLAVTTHAVHFKLLTASLNELQISSSPSTQSSQVTTLRSSTDRPEGQKRDGISSVPLTRESPSNAHQEMEIIINSCYGHVLRPSD